MKEQEILDLIKSIVNESPNEYIAAEELWDIMAQKGIKLEDWEKKLLIGKLKNIEEDGHVKFLKDESPKLDISKSNDAALNAFLRNQNINPKNKIK